MVDGIRETDVRAEELKAFDDTKAGVKGLVDSGVNYVPGIFIHPNAAAESSSGEPMIPVIDLAGALGDDPVQRVRVVGKVCEAAETHGFFQVVNHGIAVEVLEDMIGGARGFFEQDLEEKKKYFSRDYKRSFVYNSNFDLYISAAACWRDSLSCVMTPTPNVDDIPAVCREIMPEYSKQVMKLAHTLLELLSEALGLPSTYLKDIGCGEGHVIHSHYSPACPEPEKTICTPRHSDNTFITVLLQDQRGGLQIMHEHHWFDVAPVPGALLLSNDKFKSVEHRVLPNRVGPRVSLASFFNGTRLLPNPRMYGPIKELLSEENPAKYRETTLRDFLLAALDRGTDGTSGLLYLKL
ncbi:hypothetical protein V2J09_006054 [Rumex salicifolius]